MKGCGAPDLISGRACEGCIGCSLAAGLPEYNEHMPTDDDKQWIAKQIAALIAASEERMLARIEKTETTLLTEFHKWAFPVEMRQRTHAAVLLSDEMEALLDRMKKLEAS